MAWKNVGLWVLQVGAAGMFLMAGGAKLGNDPKMIGVFDAIGLGQWFRYLTGGLEVLGAIGLLTPFASGAAALGLAAVMVGAVGAHVLVLGGSAAPALVLLIAATLIAYGRRDQIIGLLRQVAK